MEVKWTEDQLRVIETRGCNILVSAAAGSGKTAVLVERIIERITDKKEPVDIDHMLIVTFTNAAAAEMRERITERLEKLREKNPEDELLERQLTLVHNAMIATIDSFCLFVVKNHFEEIDLDPNFRIADTGELELLSEEVLDSVFEANYEKKPSSFLQLIQTYSDKKGQDTQVKEMIKKVYRMASSASWPLEWMEKLGHLYETDKYDEFLNSDFISDIKQEICCYLKEARQLTEAALEIASMSKGLEKTVSVLLSDLENFSLVSDDMEIDELLEGIRNFSYVTFPSGKNAENKEQVKQLRDTAKSLITDTILSKYGKEPLVEVFHQNQRLCPLIQEIIRLSMEFYCALEREKRDRKIASFADIEHFALQILVNEKTKEPTPVAEVFRHHFDEIMIDEYQDSNQVQEDILTAVSGMAEHKYNMFMVGDVKQSIYRFRMAKPELFMDKYKRYSATDPSMEYRIDLSKNFRSRREVLDFTNDIFYKIMQEDMGGVAYDDAAALYPGASYEENPDMKPEILLYDAKSEGEPEEDLEDISRKQIEAEMIKNRIQKLIACETVLDKQTGQKRPVRYSDIVILLRGLGDFAEEISRTLSEAGIPVHVQSKSGYFSAYEIQVLLDFLAILDNPYQDIPMAAVLKSSIVGLSDEDMAELATKKMSFSEAVLEEMEKEEGNLYEFGILYHKIRKRVGDTSIHKLLQYILDETGFYDYCCCLPNGQKRKANITMLLEKAIAYEKTSYKGLFHFLKYIQKIRKYDLDGEADVVGEGTDSVRIMTIHKSKGLEFPIVFLGEIHKKFMEKDAAATMLVHEKLGIGLVEYEKETRMKRKSMIHHRISEQMKMENRGEELRILYVALTRAKEKLILTGYVENRKKLMESSVGNAKDKAAISYVQRLEANSYLKWLIPSVMSYVGTEKEKSITWLGPEDLILEKAKEFANNDKEMDRMYERILSSDETLDESLRLAFSYSYPYETKKGHKSKYSVSEIKHQSMVANFDREEGLEAPSFAEEKKESYIPDFLKEDKDSEGINQGAERGTAVHRFLECFDFKGLCEQSDKAAYVTREMERMVSKGLITREMQDLLHVRKLISFLSSDTATRMALAAERNELFREKPFVMEHEDGYLIQGIIDVFWFEENKIVLLDYKTDRVHEEEELRLRYETQLELYKDALQRIFDNKTKGESLIYSFALEKTIEL